MVWEVRSGMPPGFKADEALVALAEKCMQAEENYSSCKGNDCNRVIHL